MKSDKPLVLVVSRSGTVQRKRRGVGQRSHLRLVATDGVAVARVVAGGVLATTRREPRAVPARASLVKEPASAKPLPASSRAATPPAERPPPPSLARPFGQRVMQAANDVAVLALALLSGLRPRA
jgi:hypothetical protein